MAITGTFFSSSYYLTQYSDVAANWAGSALSHYTQYGASENRAPNSWFNAQYYRANNSDLSSLTAVQLFEHYETYGYAEGRVTSSTYANFNEALYLSTYSDLGTAGITTATALNHYLMYGAGEGRTAKNDDGTTITGTTTTTGTTYTLTTNADNLTGAGNNDTFNALVDGTGTTDTITAADVISGGAGTDTLNVTTIGAAVADVLQGALVTGVEVVSIRNTVATGTVFGVNATGLTGVTATGIGDVSATNMASGVALTTDSTGAAIISQTYVATATAAATNITGGAALGTVTYVGAGLTGVTINTTGATASTTGAVDVAGAAAINIAAASNLTVTSIATTSTAATLTVTGAGAVNAGTALDTGITTVNASGNSGGVTAILGAVTQIFTGGTGNDVITNMAGASVQTGAINAGAGTDRVVFTANGQLTAASGAKYTNFEVLQSTGATDIDMDNISGITALRTSGNATFTDVTATQAAAITTIASGNLNIGVKDAGTPAQLDTVSITTSSTNVAVAIGTLTVADVETINLTASTGTGLTSITTLAHDDWATLNLSGSSAITVTTTATAAVVNTAINGSTATGILTIDAALSTTNGLAITGGSAADVITGSAQADAIVGGAGADVITGGLGADTLTGGAGADILISVAAATATDGSGVGIDVITDFNTGGTADILRIAAANNIAGAGGSAVAATSVLVSAGAKATFGAADDTLAECITTLVADAAITANEVVFFELSGSTYVYGAGATADGTDDFMVKLTGVTGMTTLTESTTTAGDFTLA